MKAAIGIDIGGTKVSVVLGTEKGKILARKEFPTPLGLKSKLALPRINAILTDFLTVARLRKIRILGVGVGVPGAVNTRLGKIPRSPNLPGWEKLPLKKEIETRFHLPVFLANDAKAAACAEKVFGTAKNISNFVYVTVSTGIGSGIFVNGCLLEGAGFSAGEIGHVPIVPNGNLCGCGRHGCLEAHASGTAIAKLYTKISGKNSKGARDVAQAAARGDTKAIEAFEIAGAYLGVGLGIVMNVLNPEMIVLGGGVFKSAPKRFLQKAFQRCKQVAWKEAYQSCEIRPSILKGTSGDLGALALVFM